MSKRKEKKKQILTLVNFSNPRPWGIRWNDIF